MITVMLIATENELRGSGPWLLNVKIQAAITFVSIIDCDYRTTVPNYRAARVSLACPEAA